MTNFRRLIHRLRFELAQTAWQVFAFLFGFLTPNFISVMGDSVLRLRLATLEYLRMGRARRDPAICPTKSSPEGEIMRKSVLERAAPWNFIDPPPCSIPGMLSKAERRYYSWLAGFYSGAGEVVEIGPWLGLSTHTLLGGLIKNPSFEGRRLHVYDDFTWRSSWMDKWLKGSEVRTPKNHESFEEIFLDEISQFRSWVSVSRQKILDYDGNEQLEKISWDGRQIELIVVDCGRTLEVNEAWWEVFSPSFIADCTLVVMQDWQNHKAVPEVSWENTKLFTDRKGRQLDLIHEVRGGGIGTFLYRGKPCEETA